MNALPSSSSVLVDQLVDGAQWAFGVVGQAPGLVGDLAHRVHLVATEWGVFGAELPHGVALVDGYGVRLYVTTAFVILVTGAGALVYGLRERRRVARVAVRVPRGPHSG